MATRFGGNIWLFNFSKKRLNQKDDLNGEVFNFGPKNSQDKTVKDVILEIKKHLPTFKWKIKKNKLFSESKLLKLNSSKAMRKLKWSNKLSFNETLKMTANWYEAFYKKKIISFTLKQIKEFEKNYESINFSRRQRL